MKSTLIALAAAGLVCASGMAGAQSMQPGLWEMNTKSDAMKNMPKLSPQQIEMMKQKGIQMPSADGTMSSKVCISKEMAERDQPIDMHQRETGCQAKNYQKTSSGYSVDIVCDGPRMKGEGKAKGTFSGKQSFASTYDFKGTAHGQPVNQHVESSGKWLSADCGSVKSLDQMMPAKK